MKKLLATLITAFSFMSAAVEASACNATPGLTPPPVPTVEPDQHALLAHTVTESINVSVDSFRQWFFQTPLEQMLTGTRRMPAVLGTAAVTEKRFPEPGSIRKVCLADGSSALETVTELTPGRFRYLVWAYTLEDAKPLLYGHGEFIMSANGNSTNLQWTYSFRLKGDHFPGYLGPIGRFLFRVSFLDRSYVEFMDTGMSTIKRLAENQAGLQPR
jgi:hypothetical protein